MESGIHKKADSSNKERFSSGWNPFEGFEMMVKNRGWKPIGTVSKTNAAGIKTETAFIFEKDSKIAVSDAESATETSKEVLMKWEEAIVGSHGMKTRAWPLADGTAAGLCVAARRTQTSDGTECAIYGFGSNPDEATADLDEIYEEMRRAFGKSELQIL